MKQLILIVALMSVATARGQVDAGEVTRAMARESAVRAPTSPPLSVLRTEPAVLLARAAWLEAGANVVPGEVAAFHEVAVSRAAGRNYQAALWAYSVGLRNPRRASTHQLGRAPLGDGWPPIFRDRWPQVLAAADAAVAGTLRHACATDRPLVHWGGPHVDRAALGRLERAGHVRVECPGYANVFLVRGVP
jgi:soluble lytic murein transglycosylase-like protein